MNVGELLRLLPSEHDETAARAVTLREQIERLTAALCPAPRRNACEPSREATKPGGDQVGVTIGDFATTRVEGDFSPAARTGRSPSATCGPPNSTP